ncbi:Leucine-rich repeat-containing protein [Nesidiocoris tenuis]|uniref:Leucine-rich repeat-containing protein 51 n=1 Tax=Nesidiocoris tenuis TaxID=355587 RepID=A0ABN7AXI0_9HEMI|nr:Leucine-rich repeat-containing protein [Nesidiocoris tenuis]
MAFFSPSFGTNGAKNKSIRRKLDSGQKCEASKKNLDEDRVKENQSAFKRNKSLAKEAELIAARYLSRSLYSPVDGHLEASKLKYLKRLKELRHHQAIRRFREPECDDVGLRGSLAIRQDEVAASAEMSRPISQKVIKNISSDQISSARQTEVPAFLVTADVTPVPLPRTRPANDVLSSADKGTNITSNLSDATADTSVKRKISPMAENFGPPLDYSFKGLTSLDSLKDEKPRKGVKSYKKSSGGRYSCTSLRLNNNYLDNINGIHGLALKLLEFPEKLTWLDLSFNKLTSISPELASLKNLKIIYLHGNVLVDLLSVLKPLKMLEGLYSLTLHGNPLEERKGYRNKVIASLPHLKSLDFNNVTSADRKRIAALQHKKKSPTGNH